MTQALYSSMTGLKAGTEQLTVVSDNIANMNTTAYKSYRVDFQDIWYQTSTTGTNSTTVSGGTNPYQVGVGVRCASITKDLTPGSTTSTGIATDMAIAGNGYFCVQNGDGETLYTRDGTFSIDELGYLVTANGDKVLGTNSVISNSSSSEPLKFPLKMQVVEHGSTDIAGLKNKDLNNVENITNGTFSYIIHYKDGTTSNSKQVTIDGIDGNSTVQEILNVINADTTDFKMTASDGCVFVENLDPDNVDFIEFCSDPRGGTNFISQLDLNGNGTTKSKVLNYSATLSEVDSISDTNTLLYDSFSVGKDGRITLKYSDGSTLSINSDDGKSYYFTYTDSAGVIINGDVNNTDKASLFVDEKLLPEQNLQIQIAMVANPNGLVATGNNQYSVGVNSGEIYYTAGNINGAGEIISGSLESSNVDLAQQFSNMILAQRLVQANSQVFNGANQMLQTLVYLGQ